MFGKQAREDEASDAVISDRPTLRRADEREARVSERPRRKQENVVHCAPTLSRRLLVDLGLLLDPPLRELRPGRGAPAPIAKPRLCGPWAKTCTACGTSWAASEAASRYVCSAGRTRPRLCAKERTAARCASPTRRVTSPASAPDVASSPKKDQAGRAVRLGLHRGDRVAENGEVDRFVRISAVRERGQPGEMPARREPDHADPRRASRRAAGESRRAARSAARGVAPSAGSGTRSPRRPTLRATARSARLHGPHAVRNPRRVRRSRAGSSRSTISPPRRADTRR